MLVKRRPTVLQIVEKNRTDLIAYENNPRNNDEAVKFVAESIKRFGFRVPVIVGKDNVIICGHTRVKAAEKLGLEMVPCIIADDLTPEQIKAFRLADNKVSEASSWDFDKLDEELLSLEMDDFDMAGFGFADTEHIEWADVPELSETSYEPPKQQKLCCPNCGHIAGVAFFKKVEED